MAQNCNFVPINIRYISHLTLEFVDSLPHPRTVHAKFASNPKMYLPIMSHKIFYHNYNVSNANLSFGISCRFQANFFASSLQVDSVTPKVDTMSVFLSTLLDKSGTNSNGAFIPSEA